MVFLLQMFVIMENIMKRPVLLNLTAIKYSYNAYAYQKHYYI